MESLNTALVAYLITAGVALAIAGVLQLVARGIKHLKLQGDPELPTNTSPPPGTAPDLTPVAVAIAVARHRAASPPRP
jgi:hypothetical protein